MRGILILMIRFADSVVLHPTTNKDIQTALIEMEIIFLTLKWNINTIKIKITVRSKQYEQEINMSHKENRIEKGNKFKYLRSIISNEGKSEK